jgi:hypothetical protein
MMHNDDVEAFMSPKTRRPAKMPTMKTASNSELFQSNFYANFVGGLR